MHILRGKLGKDKEEKKMNYNIREREIQRQRETEREREGESTSKEIVVVYFNQQMPAAQGFCWSKKIPCFPPVFPLSLSK